MNNKISILLSALLLLSAQSCWASPTGLNNIPTTDVVPDKTLVGQAWSEVGDDAKPLYMLGFKYGILDRVEVGLDSKVGSGDGGPIAFQTKLKAFSSDFGFSSLIGIEGMTTWGDFGDNIVPYGVLSQDIKIKDLELFRVNTGYGFQKDNFSVFGGVDRTLKVFEQDLVLRSDIKQVNDMDDLLISTGFLLTLPFNFAVESWLSIPTASGAEESVVVKFNYIINF